MLRLDEFLLIRCYSCPRYYLLEFFSLFPSSEMNMHNYILRNKMQLRVMVRLSNPRIICFFDIQYPRKTNPCGFCSCTVDLELQTLISGSHEALL